jgi:hypothetical protein
VYKIKSSNYIYLIFPIINLLNTNVNYVNSASCNRTLFSRLYIISYFKCCVLSNYKYSTSCTLQRLLEFLKLLYISVACEDTHSYKENTICYLLAKFYKNSSKTSIHIDDDDDDVTLFLLLRFCDIF